MNTLLLAGLALLLMLPAPASAAAATDEADLYPAVGQVVAPFTAQAVDGSTREVSYAKGSATVLLFFLSSCPTCHRMLPEWNRAWERRPKGLEVVGVMLDREPPGWFTVNPLAFPVVRSPGRALLDAYRVHRVPVTVRIGPGGRIEDVGRGILDPIRLGELFRPPR
jgi:peroxiredoxin